MCASPDYPGAVLLTIYACRNRVPSARLFTDPTRASVRPSAPSEVVSALDGSARGDEGALFRKSTAKRGEQGSPALQIGVRNLQPGIHEQEFGIVVGGDPERRFVGEFGRRQVGKRLTVDAHGPPLQDVKVRAPTPLE